MDADAPSNTGSIAEAELERVTTERDDAYALIRHYADTDPEVALAERMRPVVEAAKACADCDCESPRHDDDGNLFLPKGGYPCAWDCPHLEGLLDAVEAYRVATSEQETPREQSPQAAADEWNDAHPIGTPVWYWPGLREDGIEAEHSTTRTAASVLGGHTAVVWVEGRGDCIALTHVEASEQETSDA